MKQESSNLNAGEAENIFRAALAFSVTERAAYLAGACGDNLSLRQRVEALLSAEKGATALMSKQPEAAARGTIAIRPTDEAAGTVLGRYKLLQQIGEGGCGVVYMADQEEPVRRRVALKVIKLGMDTRQVIARFEAERQALALMDHPNIAKVLDAGATETGRPYFVMELVRGIPITRYCDENHLSTAARLGLFVKVCQAIQHAHQKGIIHRDIKPSNVLVADHDGVAVPKIIDFGIAKATTDQRLTDKTLFTAFEQFIGTPAYMSPEQAKLSGLDIDTRSDIYSLGVLLYELLMGKTPFESNWLLAGGLDEIRRIIREEEPVRPSTRLHTLDAAEQTAVAKHRQSDGAKLVHLLRGDLDWIVMKCLEKDRARRYETANGLAMDIQRHLQNEPVNARPPSKVYRFQKMVCRNKLAFGAAGALAGSLILGLAICSYLLVREKEARRSEAAMRVQAEGAQKKAQTEAARAEAASLEAQKKEIEIKTTLSASEFRQGSRAISEGHPADALAYLARSFADDPSNEAALTTMATLLASRPWMAPMILLKPANSAAFSPDGKRIVTASDDGTAQVWDAQNGEPLAGLPRIGHKVTSVQFSPDGMRIATAAGDQVRIWDAQNGQPLGEPMTHDGLVTSAQFSPNGARLVTVHGSTVLVWDALSGRRVAELRHRALVTVNAAQFSPDGKRIVTAAGGVARVWDAQNGKPLTEPLQHSSVVSSARFSPDGKYILTSSRDGTARVWRILNGQPPLAEVLKHGNRVSSAQFSPDGHRIVTASSDATARVWDGRSGQPLTEPLKHASGLLSAQFSADGKQIVTVSRDQAARVWNADTGQPLTEPLQHSSALNSAQFSPDGKLILTATVEGMAWLWDVRTGKQLSKPLIHRSRVNSAQFSPDGKRIVTASQDGTARVWDAQSGEPLAELRDENFFSVSSAEFSPDGKRIVTVSRDETMRVWDAQNGEQLLQLAGDVTSARYSPDGERILTASGTTARVWDALTGQALTEPLQNNYSVSSAQFSPDGKRIVTATLGGGVRVWDVRTGQQLADPLMPDRAARPGELRRGVNSAAGAGLTRWAVNSAQFSPDGKRIVTAGNDGTARVWDIAPSQGNRPAWLPQLAEVISGQSINKQGLLEPTKLNCAEVINRLRQELNREPKNDDWVLWGKWFLADPLARTISPFSEQTFDQYIEDRIKEKTAESLDEAERLADDNDRLLKRIAEARSTSE
ncbi:MAG: protein kinase domain-containing protein [Limisphaerales bacterium]